jgi:hypothetical protein
LGAEGFWQNHVATRMRKAGILLGAERGLTPIGLNAGI